MEAAEDNTTAPEREEKADALSSGPTGIAGSDLERRAASRLVEELESKGRAARLQEVRIPASESATLALHSAIVIAASLLGLKWPAIGATICLIATFSFYSERGLGLRLIGRAIPGRRTSNVLSPPPGPAWEEVEVILATGYDVPDSYPVGEWLSRRFSGRITTDRFLFYGGMIGTFAALMMRAVGIEDTSLDIFQTLTTAIPMAVIAAQIDRHLAGTPIATQEDLAPARDVMAAAQEADNESEGDSGVAVCLFGAEYAAAGGANTFFSDSRLKLKDGCALVNLVRGARASAPEVTGSEGDLMPTRMSPDLAASSPLKPKTVALRNETAATIARRRGLRATSVVGRGEAGVDLLLDASEGALPDDEAET
ncbi:MAG: hypothetical protein KDB54_01895 [Solirubrobacterales bacterium]|nr:hypothetical protein [Solirubrobacterales bacterium]MCB0859382.1 hypothetical protein [Solirubrobacterales bacterium]